MAGNGFQHGGQGGTQRNSQVEEAGAGFLGGKRAGVITAEETVAIPGDEAVSPIAEGTRHKSQSECCGGPGSGELLEDEDGRVGTVNEGFAGFVVVGDHIDGVEVVSVRAVAAHDAGSEGTLQRGEAENIPAVVAQDELDQAVAQSADAVVEEGGVWHWIW